MNDAATSTLAMLFICGMTYGCYKFITSENDKLDRKELEDKALYERLVIAVENLTIQKEPAK